MRDTIYAPTRPCGRETVRPIPADHEELPSYRWPSERRVTPTHCGHCGARLLRSDMPSADHPMVIVSCLMCARNACELVADGYRERIEARRLEADGPVRRGRPPSSLANRQAAYRERRAAGLVTRKRWAKLFDACVVCGTTEKPHNGHGRCTRCRDKSQEPWRLANRSKQVGQL